MEQQERTLRQEIEDMEKKGYESIKRIIKINGFWYLELGDKK